MSSEYFKQLDAEARQRYRQKLMFEGQELPDPLDADVVRFSFSSGCKNIPPVSAADIFVYLVEGVCFYTKEQFKNFKLSDAYNSFVNGKVKRVSSFKAGKFGEGVVLIVASVEASQTLSKTYQSWCVVRDDGAVASAHCTCIAGWALARPDEGLRGCRHSARVAASRCRLAGSLPFERPEDLLDDPELLILVVALRGFLEPRRYRS
ncbi:hypothetical protein HPB52_008936 [Rhipicephalus sanguineus]|uniref:Uncharacterized protein n=2 Tax=Rhipicephalus sanguineus TaxID=34632 RepID=A0A9D4T5A6_RHISA|nr:hypothetical protein HPB52_008936 [Rhipicephalus sanguineus]